MFAVISVDVHASRYLRLVISRVSEIRLVRVEICRPGWLAGWLVHWLAVVATGTRAEEDYSRTIIAVTPQQLRIT